MHVELAPGAAEQMMEVAELPEMEMHHVDPLTGEDEFADEEGAVGAAAPRPEPVRSRAKGEKRDPGDPSTWGKVGRNALCPCGSGKKYKHCHGALS